MSELKEITIELLQELKFNISELSDMIVTWNNFLERNRTDVKELIEKDEEVKKEFIELQECANNLEGIF
jgi:uncharacterized coiled-coil protein SlyX